MIKITIDGKEVTLKNSKTLIEAAEDVGIYIPRFCYHKKLSIAANCRMCLVEVENMPKLVASCATPAIDGMNVFTRSKRVIAAQKSVMEFLLINHPLDCPICDQGGECELQDQAVGYGKDHSAFTNSKRTVIDPDLGSLIATDMNRCIYCTRCIRFEREVAGVHDLGAIDRGEDTKITTYIKKGLTSELSGNVIDLCPVGALTSKPFRFKARAWELKQSSSIAPHDCVGSNINVHSLRGKVMRVVPSPNESINETWISDRDRFSYLGLYHEDRVERPLIKTEGSLKEVDWTTALDFACSRLKYVVDSFGAEQVASLISPSSTLEELYLMQKLMRGFGSNNIDHRLRQTDVSYQEGHPTVPSFELKIEEIECQDKILLIGSNIKNEQPIINNRIRKATLKGSDVICINPIKFDFNFKVDTNVVIHPLDIMHVLSGVVKLLASGQDLPKELLEQLKDLEPSLDAKQIAAKMQEGERKVIFLGSFAFNHPAYSTIHFLAQTIAKLTNASFCCLTQGANTAGAWIAGAVPHRLGMGKAVDAPGIAAQEALTQKLKAYLLFGLEPELDCANPSLTITALKEASCVIAFSQFENDILKEVADVIFPITPFAENSGTYVNAQGVWQYFNNVTQPFGESKPGWKVLRVIANLLEIDGFEYLVQEEIIQELQNIKEDNQYSQWEGPLIFCEDKPQLTRITEWPLYRDDSLVRRAKALQEGDEAAKPLATMNIKTANDLSVCAGTVVNFKQREIVKLIVDIDERIPDNCIYIPAGFSETERMGEPFGPIEIVKC